MNPVLLFDGSCGFCSRIVRWVLRHERRRTLCFASLDSAFAHRLLQEEPHWLQLDTVLWVDRDAAGRPERVLARSEAVLQLVRYVGGVWGLLRGAAWVPRSWRDAVYDRVARNRHRVFASRSCPLPRESNPQRFLDAAP